MSDRGGFLIGKIIIRLVWEGMNHHVCNENQWEVGFMNPILKLSILYIKKGAGGSYFDSFIPSFILSACMDRSKIREIKQISCT